MRYLKKIRGFSLIEVMVSVSLFALLMGASAQIFTKSFASYRNARNVQKEVETAQFVLNSISKELRTSSVVSPGSSSTVTAIQFFDHSQDLCIRYRISSGALEVARAASPDVADCQGRSLSGFSPLTTGTVTGSFFVVPTSDSSDRIGKVTVALQILEATGSLGATIQTTASLRDYGNAGF